MSAIPADAPDEVEVEAFLKGLVPPDADKEQPSGKEVKKDPPKEEPESKETEAEADEEADETSAEKPEGEEAEEGEGDQETKYAEEGAYFKIKVGDGSAY
jgi:hypothetical protein